MDSLSQIALGAAVSVAVMGRRTAVWKAALWGAVAGTLPDLDVLIDHGDAIRNMVLHRGETHALFWLTLFSLPFAAGVAWLSREWVLWRRWWLAMWLALVTHPLLGVWAAETASAANCPQRSIFCRFLGKYPDIRRRNRQKLSSLG